MKILFRYGKVRKEKADNTIPHHGFYLKESKAMGPSHASLQENE